MGCTYSLISFYAAACESDWGVVDVCLSWRDMNFFLLVFVSFLRLSVAV